MSTTSPPRVLIVLMGETEPEIVARHGAYDRWFMASLEEGETRCDVVAACAGETLPRPDAYGGLILTGSPASVRDEAPWMMDVARWALGAAEAGIPVLGVCFGLQLLGEALGGRVERNPRGGEYGTVEVELTEEGRADPLFAGLGPALQVQATHQDALLAPPTRAGVTRLAGNASTRWQAFALGDHLRAVQFHPELAAETLADLLALRQIPAVTRPCPHGRAILQNWDRHWVRRA